MGFDPKLLNSNEEILLDLRPHWWFVTPQAAILLGAIVLGIVAAALGVRGILLIICFIPAVIAAGNLAWRWLVWNGNNFVITTDRLVHRTGVVAKTGIEIPLERINTVFFNQSIFERMIGSGDLSVESAGEGGQQNFADVRKPALVQQEIYRAMEINKDQEFTQMAAAHAAAAGQLTAPGLSIPEQIEQLDQLRLRGVITESEFQRKKAELLDRM
ncbi:MAG: PH domain-containing protein [Actinomycetota bacterium]